MSIRRLKARGIGRLELLAWLNELLETDYTKIEHLADGIAYCQVLDALHPGKVPLHQVHFLAKSHVDYERNFRVLRRVFQACDIHKEIPVRKLVDGVFQEHFEFLHWLHDYAHKTYPDAVRKYNGFARRQQVQQGGGHTSLSLRELDNANMNLVPSYAASSKVASNGFLRSGRLALALDILDPEEVPDTLTLDDLVAEVLSPAESGPPHPDRPVSNCTTPKPTEDPLLRFVQNSYESTLQAERVLTQLDKSMTVVLADSSLSKAKSSRPKSKMSQTKATKQKTIEPVIEPPFLAPQLEELIEVLTHELSGRTVDLHTLDDEVQHLVDRISKQQNQVIGIKTISLGRQTRIYIFNLPSPCIYGNLECLSALWSRIYPQDNSSGGRKNGYTMDPEAQRTVLAGRPKLQPLSSLGLRESSEHHSGSDSMNGPEGIQLTSSTMNPSSVQPGRTPPPLVMATSKMTPHARQVDPSTGYRYKHRKPKAKRNRKGWGPYQSVTKERSVDFNLTLDIQTLKQEIQQLAFVRDLLQSRALQLRHSPTGSLMQIVREYYEFFREGFRVEESSERRHVITAGAQRDFLYSVIDPGLDFGNGLVGVEFLIEMLRRYSYLMRFISMTLNSFTIIVMEDDHVIIKTQGTLHIQILRETVATIFPHIMGNEWLCSRLIGAHVITAASVTYSFNANNKIYKVEPDTDYVTAFTHVLQDPEDVVELMGQCKINDQVMLGVTEDYRLEDLDPYAEPEAEHDIGVEHHSSTVLKDKQPAPNETMPHHSESQHSAYVSAPHPEPQPAHQRLHGPSLPLTEFISVVEHYLVMFANGWIVEEPSTASPQFHFLEQFVSPNVVVGNAVGYAAIEHNWKSFGIAFDRVHFRAIAPPQLATNDTTVCVDVHAVYTLGIDMSTLEAEFPHVLRRPELVQALLETQVTCPSIVRFEWVPSSGMLVTRIRERLDWDAALTPLLPRVQDRMFVLDQAKLTPEGLPLV